MNNKKDEAFEGSYVEDLLMFGASPELRALIDAKVKQYEIYDKFLYKPYSELNKELCDMIHEEVLSNYNSQEKIEKSFSELHRDFCNTIVEEAMIKSNSI